ncbi:hypothetical protein cypCar_00001895 [Cyprinus carpio]|nr:hypothetical protein cypCar_00001895 [Cyprinus carpio]
MSRAKDSAFLSTTLTYFLPECYFPKLYHETDVIIKEEAVEFLYNESTASVSDNIMDKWIQSFTQSLIQFFRDEMGALTHIEFLCILCSQHECKHRAGPAGSNTGESGTEDCMRALETLFSVLFSMCRLMAPFTLFITELMYQNLRHLIDPASVKEKDTGSIHYLMLPHVRYTALHISSVRLYKPLRLKLVICFIVWSTLGLVIRDRKTLPVKYLLKEVLVIHQTQRCSEISSPCRSTSWSSQSLSSA